MDPMHLLQPAATRVRDPLTGRSLWLSGGIARARLDEDTLHVELAFAAEHGAADRASMAEALIANLRGLGFHGPVVPTVVPRKVPEVAKARPAPDPVPGMSGPGMGPHGGPIVKKPLAGVQRVLCVASGKGGVGKSTVATNLAVGLRLLGLKVGLLDADIYGPSIPLMMGATGQPDAETGPDGQPRMQPLQAHGIKLMSVGFLVDDSQPVIWRGPMVSQLLRQFLYQVDWAPLDYLIIDMPPGTGDVALTLAQSLQNVGLTGAITVTTPQQVAAIDVIKSMEMFRKVNVPLLGIVENMAYFTAPDTGARYDIFGTGAAERLADRLGVPLLGQIPLGMSIRAGGDDGRPAVLSENSDAYADVFQSIAQRLAARVSVLEHI